MKRKGIFALSAVLLLASSSFGQSISAFAGRYNAFRWGQWAVGIAVGNSATGSQTITLAGSGQVTLQDGRQISPFAIGTPVLINDGSNSETVTPTAVSNCGGNALQNTCTITATFSNAHGAGPLITVSSGTLGLQEAVNAAKAAGGGVVVVDGAWSGTTAMITAAVSGTGVGIEDLRSGSAISYQWAGTTSGFVKADLPQVSANGGKLIPFVNEELLTLSTGGTTTDTTANLLPANSIILSVGGIVTTTISGGTCSGWELGDATTAARFTVNDTTLTANEAKVNTGAYLTTGIASATTGMAQSSAAKVRVTCATGAPGAGVVRITVAGLTFGAATQ